MSQPVQPRTGKTVPLQVGTAAPKEEEDRCQPNGDFSWTLPCSGVAAVLVLVVGVCVAWLLHSTAVDEANGKCNWYLSECGCCKRCTVYCIVLLCVCVCVCVVDHNDQPSHHINPGSRVLPTHLEVDTDGVLYYFA